MYRSNYSLVYPHHPRHPHLSINLNFLVSLLTLHYSIRGIGWFITLHWCILSLGHLNMFKNPILTQSVVKIHLLYQSLFPRIEGYMGAFGNLKWLAYWLLWCFYVPYLLRVSPSISIWTPMPYPWLVPINLQDTIHAHLKEMSASACLSEAVQIHIRLISIQFSHHLLMFG